MVFTAFSPVAPPWADVIRQGCRKPGTLTPINWSREGWFPPHAPFVAETTYFLRESRISRSSITSSGVAAGPSSGLGKIGIASFREGAVRVDLGGRRFIKKKNNSE